MDADYDLYEIVKVIPDFWLFDAESYQRNYRTNHGKSLASGFYVVSWPEVIRVRRFNEQAAFHGPFACRQKAQSFLKAMRKHKYLLIPPPKQRAINAPIANQVVEKKVA
jgi:hypothetical protein